MKCSIMIKSALALVLGLGVSAAFAGATYLSEDFSSYPADTLIKTTGSYTDGIYPDGTFVSGWYAGENDESKVVSRDGNNILQLNTEGDSLSNTLAGVGIDVDDVDVWLEQKVQFVPSDELTTIAEDNYTKIGFYAYQPEGSETAELVVYHAVQNIDCSITKICTRTGKIVSTNDLVSIKIVAKKFGENDDDYIDSFRPLAFQIYVDNEMISCTNAYTAEALAADYYDYDFSNQDGSWFLAANTSVGDNAFKITALNATGTGFFDDIVYRQAPPSSYIVSYTVTGGTTELPVSGFDVPAGVTTQLIFTADANYGLAAVTNNGVEIEDIVVGADSYTISVSEAANVEVYFVENAPTGFEAGENDVPGAVAELTEAEAAWLNAQVVAKGITKEQYIAAMTGKEADTDYDTGAEVTIPLETKYLLNLDPTVSSSYKFVVDTIVVDTDVKVTVKLLRRGAVEGASINGTLTLDGWDDVASIGTDLTKESYVAPAAFDGFVNSETVEFVFTSTKHFFKAVIE